MVSRFRPSPAMLVACTALIVALGGSAYAVTALPRHSVGTRQLKNRAVTNPKLANGAVTAAKIAPNSITGSEIRAGTLGTVPSAANASHLGGLSPAAFVQGFGRRSFRWGTIGTGHTGLVVTPELESLGHVEFDCNAGTTQFHFVNTFAFDEDAWMDNGGSDASYAVLHQGDSQDSGLNPSADTSGEHVIWHVFSFIGDYATIYAASARQSSGSCDYFTQWDTTG
jgi:hypothetical protein